MSKQIFWWLIALWAIIDIAIMGAIIYHLCTDWYAPMIAFWYKTKIIIGCIFLLAAAYVLWRSVCRGDLS